MVYKKTLEFKEIQEGLVKISSEITKRYQIKFEHIGFENDRVALLCSFHTQYSVDEVVKTFKKISQRELFLQLPWIPDLLWGGNFWAYGYTVCTLGANIETARNVIKHKEKFPQEDQLNLL